MTKKAGVIGHPVGHSKSPLIHRYWLEKYGIAGNYETYDIAPQDLQSGVKQLIDQGLSGFNVTIPHKVAIMKLCDGLSPEAQQIGAVNTVVIDKAGRLEGRNTDGFGFIRNITETLPHFDFAAAPALVIGAGGAARAIISALSAKGAPEIILCNRTREKAESLSRDFGCSLEDWDKLQSAVPLAGLIVNTTSLGMTGQPDLDLDLSNAPRSCVVSDIVYHPLETPLLQRAKARNLRTVSGIGMLLHQARPAFEAWFGVFPDVTDELHELVLS